MKIPLNEVVSRFAMPRQWIAVALAALLVSPMGAVRLVAAPRPADDRPVTGAAPAMFTGEGGTTFLAEDRMAGREWFREAKQLYEDQRYAASAAAYVQAARAGYREDTAWYNAACSYSLAGQKARALDALKEAMKAGFESAHLLNGDSDLDPLRSDPAFRRILDDFRDSPAGREESREARKEWERAQRSRNPDRWGEAGIALLRSGDPETAAEAFRGQIRLEPSATATYNLACAEAKSGQEQAISTLEKAILAGFGDGGKIREDSDLASLRGTPEFNRLARLADDLVLFKWGRSEGDGRSRWRNDLGHFTEVAARHPQVGRAWFNLGYAQLRAGEGRASGASLEKALALNYRRPTTLYNLACAAAQIPDRDAAIAWLQKAEAAGMKVRQHAMHDRDLSPLMSDPRFRAMRAKWRRENTEQWFGGKKLRDDDEDLRDAEDPAPDSR